MLSSHEILESYCNVGTVASTARTRPYEWNAEADDARSISSTIDLGGDSDDDMPVVFTHHVTDDERPDLLTHHATDHEMPALLTHHVSDNRPLAPYTVISETRLADANERVNSDEIAAAPSPPPMKEVLITNIRTRANNGQ